MSPSRRCRTDRPSETEAAALACFEARVRRYQHSLFAFLGRMGFADAIVEELAQETFLRAWRSRSRFDERRGRYSTWLFAIARNVARDALERRERTVDVPDGERVARARGHWRASDEQERDELRRRLRAALLALGDDDREALALGCVEALSSEAAANVVGCSPAAFRTRLSRARERLRHALEENA